MSNSFPADPLPAETVRTEGACRYWAVAVTAPHAEPNEQGGTDQAVPLMACIVAARSRTDGEAAVADHFRLSFYLDADFPVAMSSVEIQLTIPEFLTFVPGLSILEAAEEAHWVNDEHGLELAGFGNPGPPPPKLVQQNTIFTSGE